MCASRLALLGGPRDIQPVEHPGFPLFTGRAIQRAVETLEQGRTVGLSRGCREIAEAEAALSKYHGGRQALGVSSGHASLHAALMGLDIGPGDEVIASPYTWGASVSCILHQGAIPVFADVDPVTGLLDPRSVDERITPRTKAIVPVHLYGQPCDMTRLCAVAKKHGVRILEDGSQAHGATWKGEVVGNFGDAAGFSCMGGKLLATGEAGYMVTPHEDVYWRACLSAQHSGRSFDPGFPEELAPYVDSLQYTYRLSVIMAVLLREQIRKLDREVEGRRRNVQTLRDALADSKYIRFPDYGEDARPSYHMVTMVFDAEAAGVSRDTFQAALAAEGFGVFHYVPSPIPTWRRMNWQGYKGPRTMWLDNLRRAKVDYRKGEWPNCAWKIEHSLEYPCNFIRPAKAAMKRLAKMVLKVEENIDDLREHERKRK